MYCRLFLNPRFLSLNIYKRNLYHACIVGSGPAGFYVAKQLLTNPDIHVDMYERDPIPFGLVRSGVAPDHPEVKNVINSFTKTGQHENFRFLGNVEVGTKIPLSELIKAYNAVVLSYGSQGERELGIPGEHLANCFSSRQFVGWYNGDLRATKLPVDLQVENVIIVGQGNIALDVGRILLSSLPLLEKTDIVDHALKALHKSRIRKVSIIGRRGPLQAAFTTKELREMTHIEGATLNFNPDEVLPFDEATIPKRKLRMWKIMAENAQKEKESSNKTCEILFYRSPLKVLGDDKVKKIVFSINKLVEENGQVKAVPTGKTEEMECGLLIKSIGYKTLPIDPSLPFDKIKGCIANENGLVESIPGLYCSGWAQRGPTGVIADTMKISSHVGKLILEDLKTGKCPLDPRPGFTAIEDLLKDIRVFSFKDWLKIDEVEKAKGEKLNKPRVKLVTYQEILEAVQ